MRGRSDTRTQTKRKRRPGSVGEAFRRAEEPFRPGEIAVMKKTIDESSREGQSLRRFAEESRGSGRSQEEKAEL